MKPEARRQTVFSSGSTRYALRVALREMRGGVRAFLIFLACIALGVGAVAGVNSVSTAITQGLEEEGRTILGGDLKFTLTHIPASEEQTARFEALGEMSKTATMRSIARVLEPEKSSDDQTLVELRAVDEQWPLVGALELSGEQENLSALHQANADDLWPIFVDPILLDRLNLKLGGKLAIGQVNTVIVDTIELEPDALSSGMLLAPRVLMSVAALEKSGLVRAGSLVDWSYTLALSDPGTVAKTQEELEASFPNAGWRVQTADSAAPQLGEAVQRFSDFLTLVSLSVLVVGSVGVANAVRAYLQGKRSVIATLKCLGAPASFITRVYLFQIFILAAMGTLIGLFIGAMLPPIAGWFLKGFLPVSPQLVYPQALGLATAFGLSTALVAALLPLGRAQNVPATALFREASGGSTGRAPLSFILAAAIIAALVAVLAIFTALNQYIAQIFVAALVVTFAILGVVAKTLAFLAKRAPRTKSTPLRLALGNIHRPGALTPSIVLSLGLGLSLLVTLSLVETNIRTQIERGAPETAPSFFFFNIQNSEREGFLEALDEVTPDNKTIVTVPMLRGTVISLKGINVADYETPEGQGEWVLEGDRGFTYSSQVPENSELTQGDWWPEDYAGEPLVSFSEEEALEVGLAIGDTITVNVLGRPLTAKIANFRKLEWGSLGINFVMVFSPNSFAGAPHAHLATLTMQEAESDDENLARDAKVLRTLSQQFPAVTAVRVKDVLDTVNNLVGQIAIGIRAAALLTLLASVLVLAGALSSGAQMRMQDAMVLKTLGATRRTLISAFAAEYGLLGLSTAFFALGSGGLAAWFVTSKIMSLEFSFAPMIAFSTIGAALLLTIFLGLIATWRILGQKVAPILREL